MATFSQAQSGVQESAVFVLDPSGANTPEPQGVPPTQPVADLGIAAESGVWTSTTTNKNTSAGLTWPPVLADQSSAGFDWFDDFHVVPRSFDFGNLLSDQSTPMEVFSAFRRDYKEWTSYTNNAGTGVLLDGLPSLPTTVSPLSGVIMSLDVSTSGPPFVDSTLVFVFTGVGTITVPIEIQRIVFWGLVPELPFTETLEFLTGVYESADATEKRESLRGFPRQAWGYKYFIDEGTDAQVFENLLFDFQSRTFGVPVLMEDTQTTVAIVVGDTTINVEATAYRDFRVGGLAAVVTSQTTFDVLEISAVTATTLVFTSPTANAYVIGTDVFPLMTCHADKKISGARYQDNLRTLFINFQPTDNVVDLADLTPFSSFNSKLLLDSGNVMTGNTVGESFFEEATVLDGKVGLVFKDPNWDHHKRTHSLTLRAEGRQGIWELRGLIHAIKGRWISFYVVRDSDDLTPDSDLVSGQTSLNVENVGYAQFVRNRQPKNVIRISFVDGSTPLIRTIIGSVSSTTTVDILTLDSTWPATYTPAEISRIEYVEKVRFDTDSMKIKHDRSGNRARLTAPVRAVFE